MKLQGGRVAAFLRRPDPEFRAVLLFGPDAGLVRERADTVARAVCPDLADPFRVAELTASAVTSDPARLGDELGAMSLVGGRRVVRLREVGDGLADILKRALETVPGDALLVIEAGDLQSAKRSALRRHCENAKDVAAIGCYPDTGRDLAEVVRETLGAHGVRASADAVTYLVDNLGNDRLVTRSELEKLALYAGDGGRIGIEEAMASVGDAAALSVEDVVMAAAEGDAAALERALLRAFQEGESPISLLRAAMRHFQRLQLAAVRAESGSVEAALNAMWPPVFYMHRQRMAEQVRRWKPRRAAAALALLTEAELDGKRTILPQEAICRDALLQIVRAAKQPG